MVKNNVLKRGGGTVEKKPLLILFTKSALDIETHFNAKVFHLLPVLTPGRKLNVSFLFQISLHSMHVFLLDCVKTKDVC